MPDPPCVDLTQEEDDAGPAQAGPSSAQAGPSSAQQDFTEDEEEGVEAGAGTQEDTFSLYGNVCTDAVGVRYYNGEVNVNEIILLEREPFNPYDGNAIEVKNVRGEKVGHISAVNAAVLSPLIDSDLLRIEGMAVGPKNKFKVPIAIYCFGPPDAESRQEVEASLFEGGLHLTDSDPRKATPGRSTANSGGAPPPGVIQDQDLGVVSRQELESALDRMFDSLGVASEEQEMLKPAREVDCGLFPHQLVALAWMVQRENSNALPPFWQPLRQDDMGLGKTLSVIALIATNRAGVQAGQLQAYRGSLVDGKPVRSPATAAASSGAEACGSGAGAGPSNKRQKGSKGAAVSTSPGGQDPPSSRAKDKGQADVDALAAQLDGPPTLPPAGGPRATLIVCPVSVLSNWTKQLQDHTSGSLRVHMQYKDKRTNNVEALASCDVVVTTYETLKSDWKGPKNRGMKAVHWLRVVLDEAQYIKEHTTQVSRAVRGLKAERRWCLSGTPLQNSLRDLFGLTCFLMSHKAEGEGEPLADKKLFNRTLEREVVKKRSTAGLKRLQVLMGQACLRRTKDMNVAGRPLISLPARTVSIVPVTLTHEDMHMYLKVESVAMRVMEEMLREEVLLQNFAIVLQVLLRLRQICDSSSLVPPNVDTALEAAARSAIDAQKNGGKPINIQIAPEQAALLQLLLVNGVDDECPICLNQPATPIITICTHVFCRACIEQTFDSDRKAPCPLCRTPLGPHLLLGPPADAAAATEGSPNKKAGADAAAAGPQRSAKVEALVQRLRANHEANAALRAAGGQGPIKAVVFSQFTSMLDLVARALSREGIPFLRLDGSILQEMRQTSIETFSSPNPNSHAVFLVSLKAGGVGLNLTAACQVHIVDPWWNPSVEDQAMDRVHRLGQTRDVEVLRYIAKGTIEERMLLLQDRKRNLQKAAFERDPNKLRQIKLDDVKLLMKLN